VACTETVTVVFTDLVGSTEPANRLGHDAYEALRHEHFTAPLIAVVRAEAEQLGMAREIVRFERLKERISA